MENIEFTGSVVLVELKPNATVRGTRDISLDPGNIAEKSAEALSKAMATIKAVAQQVITTLDDQTVITERPQEVEVTFGLKLTTDANAFIVNAGVEAQFTVKMKWVREGQEDKAT